MEFIKKLISTIALLMIIPAFGEAKKDSNSKNELSFYIVAVSESAYISPDKICQENESNYSNTDLDYRILKTFNYIKLEQEMDISCYATHTIIQNLFDIDLIVEGKRRDGPSGGLSLVLYGALRERLQKETKLEHIFATEAILDYHLFTEEERKTYLSHTEWKKYAEKNPTGLHAITFATGSFFPHEHEFTTEEKKLFYSFRDTLKRNEKDPYIEPITKKNLQFYKIGKIGRKIATIIHYVLNKKLQNTAIFVPKKHECDIQRFINEIDSSVNNLNNTKEQKENIIRDLIKLKRIIQKINTVDTYKDIETLSLQNIKTFSHTECPRIDTSVFYQQNFSNSLQHFLESRNTDIEKTLPEAIPFIQNCFLEKIQENNEDISYLQP